MQDIKLKEDLLSLTNLNNSLNTKEDKIDHQIITGDLNKITKSGCYRLESPTNISNMPPVVGYGQLLVVHGAGDSVSQLYMSFELNEFIYYRSCAQLDNPTETWSHWVKLLNENSIIPIDKGGTNSNNILDASTNLKYVRYGDWRPEWNNDFNNINESCILRHSGQINHPGLHNGNILTLYANTDTIAQIYIYHDNGEMYVRSGKNMGYDNPTWFPWAKVLNTNIGLSKPQISDPNQLGYIKTGVIRNASETFTLPNGGVWCVDVVVSGEGDKAPAAWHIFFASGATVYNYNAGSIAWFRATRIS